MKRSHLGTTGRGPEPEEAAVELAFTGGYVDFLTCWPDNYWPVARDSPCPSSPAAVSRGMEEEAEAHLRVLDAREESLMKQVWLEVRTAWFRLKNAIDSLPVFRLARRVRPNAERLAEER